jgi:ribosome recycling factor
MTEDELLKDLRRRMDGAIEVLRKEFGGLRTGRASTSLLEPVQVSAYGNSVPLNQVASINVPEPRMITVQVWDRGLAKAVDKAIRGRARPQSADRGPGDPGADPRTQ